LGVARAARDKAVAVGPAEAITRFRARAEAVSKQFGFASYALREVNVSSDGGGGPQPMYRNAPRMAASMAADESLPVESGKSTVTANVNGSVEMK
jgi:predicted secreted protein